MAPFTMRRIRLGAPDAGSNWRDSAHSSAPKVTSSPHAAENSPRKSSAKRCRRCGVVERICEDVRKRPRRRLSLHRTVRPRSPRRRHAAHHPSELALAHAAADPALLDTVRRVRQNILAFQLGMLHGDAG